MVSIQSSYTSPSKHICSSPFGNYVSCFVLTSWFYSFNFLSCGDVSHNTYCLYSFGCLSYGNVICGICTICLAAYTIVDIHTIVGTIDGSILPLIIFCAFTFMISYSLFIFELEALFFSTMFFLLKTFFWENLL